MTDHEANAVRRVAATPDPALDRPAHVRDGSGVALLGRRLAVVQDDANFLALVEPRSGVVDAVPLPAGPGGLRQFDDGRANKADKLDLEACVAVPDDERGGLRLLAFGSGSTARRERVAEARGLDGAAPALTLHELPAFYAALRAVPAFAGSELNVEGVLYAAAAEASPDATRDGDVAGSALGVIVGDAHGGVTARWAVVRDAGGEPFAGKIEGLVTTRESPARCWAVVDGDDPAAPSELCLVELEGPWYG